MRRTPPAKAASRRKLNRKDIIRAALRIADKRGLDALSMRSLAAELGVEAMSLYNYVPNKAALLDGIAEAALADMHVGFAPNTSWTERIRALSHAFRRMALKHPGAFPLVLSRQIAAPEAFRPLEIGLALLQEAGIEGPDAVHIMRAFVAYQSGSLLREVGAAHLLGAAAPAFYVIGTEELAEKKFPMVTRHASALALCDHESEYEFGLEMMIAALEKMTNRRKPAKERRST